MAVREPAVVEFTRTDGQKELFIGTSLKAILDDTQGGTSFGRVTYTCYRLANIEDARWHVPKYLDSALERVSVGFEKGEDVSYWLG